MGSRTLTAPSWESSYFQQISLQTQQDIPLADTTRREYTTSTWNGHWSCNNRNVMTWPQRKKHFLLSLHSSHTHTQNHEPHENQMRITLWLAKVAISFVALAAKTVIVYICKFGACFANLHGFCLLGSWKHTDATAVAPQAGSFGCLCSEGSHPKRLSVNLI